MKRIEVEFTPTREGARIPYQKHKLDVGHDLFCCEDINIESFHVAKIDIGISIAYPDNLACIIQDRSSMGGRGLHVFGGVIDPNYRGTIFVTLFNSGSVPVTLLAGERVAQMIFYHIERPKFIAVKTLGVTDRGVGGFGSTGK